MSWVVFLAIAGAAYWYYNQNNQPITRGRSTTRTSQDAVQWDEPEKKAKAQKQTKTKAPRKSVKSAVQEVGNTVEATLSAASSNSGADADSSSAVASSAALSNKAPSGRDVSDMLSSKPAAATVMSIKPAEKQTKVTKPQPQKTESAPETKKQRQNRKKNEEAKAAREEEEKQRQALLEKQRRTAREARGEPAKNGLSQANPPSSNPWTTVSSSRGGAVQPPAAPTSQLLDTFDAGSTASLSDAPTNGTAQTAASFKDLPTEEEQVKMAMDETAWETVAKGGKAKRKTPNEELLEENKNIGIVKEAAPAKAVRQTQAPAPEKKKPTSRYQILSEEYTKGHAQDSDWPVV